MSRTRRPNPFKPTAGMNPPELIGRDAVLDGFIEGLDNGPGAPDRLMRISGVRGVGKTVLLNALGRIAQERGFSVVNVASNVGFCERIRHMLIKGRKIRTAEAAPSVLGVSLGSVEFAPPEESLGDAMLTAAEHGGLLVTLDEIQDADVDEMRLLGNEIQLLIRQGANVAFVFAGLPAAVDDIVSEKTITFLQRAKHVELAALPGREVGVSMEDTIRGSGMEISAATAAVLGEAAAGYPFMVQLVGYYSWQSARRRESDTLEREDACRGITEARANFDAMVLEPALRRLPGMQRDYLVAMAQCEGAPIESGEVARKMGKDTKAISSYRRRLMDQGIIVKVGYGTVDFAIPYMREYLRDNMDDFA